MNCAEEREMAAHGLCFNCYRQKERAEENPWAAASKHNRSQLKAQIALRKAVVAILNSVDGAIDHFQEDDVDAIREICGRYLTSLASGLTRTPVNSEPEGGVNCSPEPEPEPQDELVNSEHENTVNCSQEPGADEDITVNSEPGAA